MRNIMVLILFGVLSTDICIGGVLTPTIKLDVLVTHEDGEPFEGVAVRVSYPGVNYRDNKVLEKETDKKGKVSFTGQTHFPLSLLAKREGCYPSRLKNIPIGEYDRQKKQFIHSDQEVTLVLREVRNAIPMYAYRIDTQLHDTAKPKGFDLMKGDWVRPYGKGEIADVVFSITGFYKDKFNYDSTLLLNFPNEGDGIISFEADEQSQFRSPYEALKKGYLGEKQLRKSRHPKPDNPEEDEITDDSRHDANYMFRIRTELDENGEVVSALYGKIYGNFSFGGATEKASYLQSGDLYLNPTPNDRNLEFDPSQNLFPGERVEEP